MVEFLFRFRGNSNVGDKYYVWREGRKKSCLGVDFLEIFGEGNIM